MLKIKIDKQTSPSDVLEAWPSQLQDDVVFIVTQDSSFRVLGEGVALGRLRDYVLQKKQIGIELHHKTANKPVEQLADSCPVFSSIFGLELIRVCSGISGSKHDGADLRLKLGRYVWGVVMENEGLLSGGHHAYFFSRDGYKVPRCLRGDSLEFPRFDYFLENCKKVIPSLRGYARFLDSNEVKLVEWLHSIFENSHDHGTFDGIQEEGIVGYRGIILQKLIFVKGEDISKRKDYPAYLENYIQSNRNRDRGTIFNVATVCDSGLGIQNTIGPLYDAFDEKDRFHKAFERGVSRILRDESKEAGYGLDQSIRAAIDLSAYYYICSAGVEASIDFSQQVPFQSSVQFDVVSTVKKLNGTSVSIIWPC